MNSGSQSFSLWWAMIEGERLLAGEAIIGNSEVVLSFMGSGASHTVTAKDIRDMLSELPK